MRSELYTGAIPVAGSPRVYSGRKSAPAPRTEQVQRLYTIPDFMRTAAETWANEHSGETACGAFRAIDLKPEDVLVISAASGGVGAVAVQLAVHRGATVIGIASEKNAEFVRSLGAIPVAYGDGLKERILKAAPTPVTKMLDCYGGDYIPLGAELGLKKDTMGTLIPTPKAMIKGAQFTGARHAQPGDLKEVADLVASGDIDVTLAHVYPFKLDSIRDGYKELGTGHVRGKLVVTIP